MQNKNISNLPLIDNCTICIVGLGYVGLPLAIEFSKIKTCLRTGKRLKRTVIGFDLNQKRIEQLKLGLDTTKETEEKENFWDYKQNHSNFYTFDYYLIMKTFWVAFFNNIYTS